MDEEERNECDGDGKADSKTNSQGIENPLSLVTQRDSVEQVPATPTTPSLPSRKGSLIKAHRSSMQSQGSTESPLMERRRFSRSRKRGSIRSVMSSRKYSSSSSCTEGQATDSSLNKSGSGSFIENESVRLEWALDQIELSDTDSELEFFDAKGEPCTGSWGIDKHMLCRYH